MIESVLKAEETRSEGATSPAPSTGYGHSGQPHTNQNRFGPQPDRGVADQNLDRALGETNLPPANVWPRVSDQPTPQPNLSGTPSPGSLYLNRAREEKNR